MINNQTIKLIGYASGLGSCDTRCCTSPLIFQTCPAFETLQKTSDIEWIWVDNLFPHGMETQLEAIEPIAEISYRLAQHVIQQIENQERFVVISGVHSSAIGTWSGAAKALDSPLGLIWIDAHMDAHTPETTHTGNVHGMPLAALLGKGDTRLSQLIDATPALQPEHVVLIGIRDYEPEEAALLAALKVKVYTMAEVTERGIDIVLQEAHDTITRKTVHFGISLDLDAIDPADAPGVSLPTPNGIPITGLNAALKKVFHQHPALIGVELAEFNTIRDQAHQTEQVMVNLLMSLLG